VRFRNPPLPFYSFPLLSLPFVLVVRALRRHTHLTMPIISPSLSFALFRTLNDEFFPFFSLLLFLARVRTHERTSAYIFVPFFSFSLFSLRLLWRERSIQTPRYYYVMPVDRGSDILCMLMPHNVGFIPLFNIYLFGSFPFSRFCCGQPHRSVPASLACLLLDLV